MINAIRGLIGILLAGSIVACHGRPAVMLPDGKTSIDLSINLLGDTKTLTVANAQGRASASIFAVADRWESNLYRTARGQLVVIEAGGEEAFFSLPKDGPPRSLEGELTSQRDTDSSMWSYLGRIDSRVFHQGPECIDLYGEGSSPYRKAYQAQDCPRFELRR